MVWREDRSGQEVWREGLHQSEGRWQGEACLRCIVEADVEDWIVLTRGEWPTALELVLSEGPGACQPRPV